MRLAAKKPPKLFSFSLYPKSVSRRYLLHFCAGIRKVIVPLNSAIFFLPRMDARKEISEEPETFRGFGVPPFGVLLIWWVETSEKQTFRV